MLACRIPFAMALPHPSFSQLRAANDRLATIATHRKSF